MAMPSRVLTNSNYKKDVCHQNVRHPGRSLVAIRDVLDNIVPGRSACHCSVLEDHKISPLCSERKILLQSSAPRHHLFPLSCHIFCQCWPRLFCRRQPHKLPNLNKRPSFSAFLLPLCSGDSSRPCSGLRKARSAGRRSTRGNDKYIIT